MSPGASRSIVITANSAWNLANFRAGLIARLSQHGWRILAVAPPDEAVPQLERLGCRFVPLPIDSAGASPLADARSCATYLRIFADERPAAVLTFTVKPNIYASFAAHCLRIPVINNISGLGSPFVGGSWVTVPIKRLYRAALKHSAVVFFQNGDDRSFFLRAGLARPEQARLIPGSGVDLQRFRPAEPASRDRGPPVFLMLARLLWDKGVGEYVEAARLLGSSAAQFRLVGFLGVENRTAVPRQCLETWLSEGLIDYGGSTDDVRPHIAAADRVVLPSYREGTPRALLEAAAMARPLIATDVTGCREVVEDGVNGYLCAPRSSAALAAAITRFCALPEPDRHRMGSASRQLAERRFDEELVVTAYVEALDCALGASALPPARRARLSRWSLRPSRSERPI